jgi:hypothetical protein
MIIRNKPKIELELRNLLHNYHCYWGSSDNRTQRMEQACQKAKMMLVEMGGCLECFLHLHSHDKTPFIRTLFYGHHFNRTWNSLIKILALGRS